MRVSMARALILATVDPTPSVTSLIIIRHAYVLQATPEILS